MMQLTRLLVIAALACGTLGCAGAGRESAEGSAAEEPAEESATREPAGDGDAGALVRDSTAPIQTDSLTYALRTEDGEVFETAIGFSFRNPLRDTIYVVNCRGGLAMPLERLEAGEWTTYWDPVLLMCLGPPIVIPPGSVYRDTMPVIGVLPGRDAGPAFGSREPEGIYRLRWHNLVLHYDDARPGFGDPVPEELTYSNRFRLLDPRRRE